MAATGGTAQLDDEAGEPMRKHLAAVAVVSIALLSGCGSNAKHAAAPAATPAAEQKPAAIGTLEPAPGAVAGAAGPAELATPTPRVVTVEVPAPPAATPVPVKAAPAPRPKAPGAGDPAPVNTPEPTPVPKPTPPAPLPTPDPNAQADCIAQHPQPAGNTRPIGSCDYDGSWHLYPGMHEAKDGHPDYYEDQYGSCYSNQPGNYQIVCPS